jgi:hypothetical protein
MKAKNRQTGEIVSVQYGYNSGNNLRLWINGKFYSDKSFDKLFEIIRTNNN